MRTRRRRSRRTPSEEESRAGRRRAEPAGADARARSASGPGPLDRLGPAPGLAGAGAGVDVAGPTVSGGGPTAHAVAFAHGPIRIEGRTDADYGSSFHTEDVRVEPAEGCGGCADCVHVTGTLVATYHVTTTVTLPSAADYSDLSACERRQLQEAIDTVLAPHEQEHVRAFRQYDGTTRRPFDLTLCRSEFDGRIQDMFDAEETARRAAAQRASDALDPFHFDVAFDCEDEAPEAENPTAPEAAPEEEPGGAPETPDAEAPAPAPAEPAPSPDPEVEPTP